jgi:hypothetical protein
MNSRIRQAHTKAIPIENWSPKYGIGYLEAPREGSVEEVSRIAYRGWLLAGVTALLFGVVIYRRRRS